MISVAMTTFNGEKYILQQLDSIFHQTREIDEVILVDDCSTDSSYELTVEYAKTHERLHVYRNKSNQGFVATFFKAISYCIGDYIFLCDQDDIWYERKVEILVKLMEKNEKIKVLASSFSFIDAMGKPLYFHKSLLRSNNNQLARIALPNRLMKIHLEDIVYHNFCQGCAIVMKREIQQEYLENYISDIYHDYFINIIAAYHEGLYFFNVPLFEYRLHANNAIGLNKEIDRDTKSTIEYRTSSSKNIVSLWENVLKKYPDVEFKFPTVLREIKFVKAHIENLENKRKIALIVSNFNPLYFRLKTLKGRIADILTIR